MTIKDCLQQNLDTPQALTQSFIGKVFASGEVKYMIPYDVSIKEKHFPLRPDDCDFTYSVYEKSVRHSIGQYCMDIYYPVGSTIQLGMYKCTITSYGTPQKNIFGNNMYYVDMSVAYVQDIEPNTCITDTETEKNAVACMNNVIATINTIKNIIPRYSRDPYDALFENNTTKALKDVVNINMVEKAYITDLAEKSMAYSGNTQSQEDISEMNRIRDRLCSYLHNIVNLEVYNTDDEVSTVFYMYKILTAGETPVKPKMCVDYKMHFLSGANKYIYLEFFGKYDILILVSDTSVYDPDTNATAFDMSFAVIDKNENVISKWMYFKSISNLDDGKYWTDVINELTASIFTNDIGSASTFDEYVENLMSNAKERSDLFNDSLYNISVDTTTGLVTTKNTLAATEYRYNLTYGKDETIFYSDYIY